MEKYQEVVLYVLNPMTPYAYFNSDVRFAYCKTFKTEDLVYGSFICSFVWGALLLNSEA